MSELLAPRINGSMLENYIGRRVKLTCKVLQPATSQGEIAILLLSDNIQIEGKLIPPRVNMEPFVEVLCTVESTALVTIMSIKNLGDKLSLEVADAAISMSNEPRFRDYFQPAQRT
ncbi:hypothetical protein EXIGLDRAFT_843768 [Exidia glandulosa HHB12029]|uniref:Replication factor A protein 3 n=1 Tax=Exidia glandulosa HHB12029 TaxID=1314781 RepID=A0A165CGN0_EXIGL|nr:hypothetical protein EXIGLDRAFT_843768 [Exidia glandulosa HHB12029]